MATLCRGRKKVCVGWEPAERTLRNIRLSSPLHNIWDEEGQRLQTRAKLRNGWKGRAAKLSREAAGPNPLLIKGDEWSVSQTLSWRLCQSKLRPALRVCIHVSGCPGDKERLSGG